MNRYYLQNPWVQGLGGLLSGFNQQQQQTQAINAQIAQQQAQQWGNAMQQGFNAAGNMGSMAILAPSLVGQNLNPMQRMALMGAIGRSPVADMAGQFGQRQAGWDAAVALENARSGNDVYEQSLRTWDALQYGGKQGTGVSSGGGMPSMVTPEMQGVGTNADGSVMSPEQAQPPLQEGRVPLPSIDPAMTSAYKEAEQRRMELVKQGMQIQTSDRSPADKAAALRTLMPELQQATMMTRRYQQPQPTMQDMVQQQTFTDPKTGVMWHPKEIVPTLGPKQNQAETLLSWVKLPDPNLREQGRLEFLRNSFGGDDQQYEAFKARGGYGEIDMTTGKVDWVEPKESKSDGKTILGDPAKNYDSMYDNLTTKEQGNVTTPDPDKVTTELKKRDAGIKQYLIESKGLTPVMNRLTDLYRQAKSLRQNGEVDMAIAQEIAALEKQLNDAMAE